MSNGQPGRSLALEPTAVSRLAAEHPHWLPVLRAALTVAQAAAPYGGEFAGTAVVRASEMSTGRRVPNLRLLVTYGILEKSGNTVRGGRRAYYRFIDYEGTALATGRLHVAPPAQLTFIGAGTSDGSQPHLARNAGEVAYAPRSWR